MEKDTGNSKTSQFLVNAFVTTQECLVSTLRSSNVITHQGDKGEVNEQHFIEFLRHYLPNRYTVEKAIVLDSEGVVSDSIDIVVFDRQYTPTLLDNDKHRYVPAEAVYAVFECKPTINKEYLEYAANKIESVRKLKRTSIDITSVEGMLSAKKPFDIIGGILAINIGWKDGFGAHFQAIHEKLTGHRRVDCGFAASQGCFDIFSSEGYAFGDENNALGFFVFRLLSKLQSLGTVPAVDWLAYSESLKK